MIEPFRRCSFLYFSFVALARRLAVYVVSRIGCVFDVTLCFMYFHRGLVELVAANSDGKYSK